MERGIRNSRVIMTERTIFRMGVAGTGGTELNRETWSRRVGRLGVESSRSRGIGYIYIYAYTHV